MHRTTTAVPLGGKTVSYSVANPKQNMAEQKDAFTTSGEHQHSLWIERNQQIPHERPKRKQTINHKLQKTSKAPQQKRKQTQHPKNRKKLVVIISTKSEVQHSENKQVYRNSFNLYRQRRSKDLQMRASRRESNRLNNVPGPHPFPPSR